MLNTIFFYMYSKIIYLFYKIELVRVDQQVNCDNTSYPYLVKEKFKKEDLKKYRLNQFSNQWIVLKEQRIIGKFILCSFKDELNNTGLISYQLVPEKTLILKEIEVKCSEKRDLNLCFNLILLKIFTHMNMLNKNRILISGSSYCLKKIHKLKIKTKTIYSKTNFTKLVLGNRIQNNSNLNTHLLKIKSNRLFKIIWKLILKEILIKVSFNKKNDSNLLLINH